MKKYNFYYGQFKFNIKSEDIISGIEEYIEKYQFKNTDIKEYSDIEINISNIAKEEFFCELKEFTKKDFKIREFFQNKYLFEYNNILIFPFEMIIFKMNKNTFSIMSANKKKILKFLSRVIREYLYRYYENEGYISFHSGAVSIKGETCLLLGKSGAGKTTLLTKLMENGCIGISNDRVLVNFNGFLETIPIHYRFGYGTIVNSDILFKYIKENYYSLSRVKDSQIELFDILQKYSDGYFDNKKFELTQREVEKCFKFGLHYNNKLKYIIIPELDIEGNISELTKITKDEAYKIILNEIMTPNDKNWMYQWIIKPNYSMSKIKFILQSILNNTIILKFKYSPNKACELINLIGEFYEK